MLDGLEATTGFRPEHAGVLVGTSIGAIGAARIGPHIAPETSVIDRLLAVAGPPPAPTIANRALAGVRRSGGRVAATLSRAGATDPTTWVDHIQPETRAQVVSIRRFPPTRRVATIATASDPVGEIAASAAVPFGARPVELDGAPHIDGALWSVTNADLVRPSDVDVLIVLAPLVTTDRGTLVSGLGRHQLASELAAFAEAGVPALTFAPSFAQYLHRRDRDRHRADGEALARRSTASPASTGSTRTDPSGRSDPVG